MPRKDIIDGICLSVLLQESHLFQLLDNLLVGGNFFTIKYFAKCHHVKDSQSLIFGVVSRLSIVTPLGNPPALITVNFAGYCLTIISLFTR